MAYSSSESPESRRTWASTSNLTKDETKSSPNAATSLTWSSALDITQDVQESTEKPEVSLSTSRTKNYAGSQSDSYTFRRHSIDETILNRPPKLQIKGVIDKSNGTNSDNDVEFTIQVRKSRTSETGSKTNSQSDDGHDGISEKGGKTEKV